MVNVQMSRKEREDWERKKYIMETAEHLFAQNGFAQTSVADIAKAAEFGVGTLYKYFNDKETLFHSLIEYRMDRFFDKAVKVMESDKEPVVVLKRYFKLYLDFIEEHFDFHKLYFGVVMADAIQGDCWENKYQNINHKKMQFLDSYLKLFQAAIRKKQIVEMDPQLSAVFHDRYVCHVFSHAGGSDFSGKRC